MATENDEAGRGHRVQCTGQGQEQVEKIQVHMQWEEVALATRKLWALLGHTSTVLEPELAVLGLAG